MNGNVKYPIGEVILTSSTSEPLGDTMDTQLTKDLNDQNIVEVKQEIDNQLQAETISVQDQLGLVNVPALPDTGHILPDATTNLLVDLPGVDETQMDTTRSVPTVDKEGQPMDVTTEISVNIDDDELTSPSQTVPPLQNLATSVPCLIVLNDVSAELKGRTSVRIPHTKEEMCRAKVCLKQIDQVESALPRLRGRKKREHGNGRPTRKAKDSVKYVFTDATSGEDVKTEPCPDPSDKSSPSGYRLAAHCYMVAKK